MHSTFMKFVMKVRAMSGTSLHKTEILFVFPFLSMKLAFTEFIECFVADNIADHILLIVFNIIFSNILISNVYTSIKSTNNNFAFIAPIIKATERYGLPGALFGIVGAGMYLLASELDRETMVFPKIDRELCVGCHLCVHVCPTGAISSANRIKKIK